MPFRITVCPYRLLFKHPFGTAHGLRDGTDALFIRVEEDGAVGFGEITLPPYVRENIEDTRARLRNIAGLREWTLDTLFQSVDDLEPLKEAPAARAGLHCALIDALARRSGHSVAQVLGCAGNESPTVLMTIGICEPDQVLQRMAELPATNAVKLKVGDALASNRIYDLVCSSDVRVLLDGNQGFASVEEAQELIELIPPGRLIGMEQPFSITHDDWNRELTERTGAVVFADESLQSVADLERVARWFGGINVKLMKCGGLDRAHELATRAEILNLRVMLGCMSESSLGCTAMAQLASEASVIDLDGPWLLRNDPWLGIAVNQGQVILPNATGLGVLSRFELDYIDL
jgi:L-Ala-D/L-Glu epimerase